MNRLTEHDVLRAFSKLSVEQLVDEYNNGLILTNKSGSELTRTVPLKLIPKEAETGGFEM